MSGGGVPYLGSRIVLISKSEIRYEGTLYTIDTQQSTVALQNVRSFGTEGRKQDGHIPPSTEVFDYIIFRGQDIKDLHVCETPTPDPAPAAPAAPPAAPPPAAPAAPAQPQAAPPSWGANPNAAKAATAAKPAASAPQQPRQPPAAAPAGAKGAATGVDPGLIHQS